MAEDKVLNDLDFISAEIEQLKKSKNLSFADTKKLELLLKLKNAVNVNVVEDIRDEEYSDHEVLQTINKARKLQSGKTQKKGKAKSKL